MPTIHWYLPLRESMSVATVDTLCAYLWFDLSSSSKDDCTSHTIYFQCYHGIFSYRTAVHVDFSYMYMSLDILTVYKYFMFASVVPWCFQHCPARSYRSTWWPSRMNSACRRQWVSGIPPALPPTEAWRTSSDVAPPRSSMVAFRCWPPWDTSPQWLGFAEAAFTIV